jgi:sucrose phosphorylase
MFDVVLNHVSAQGEWFQSFLRGEEKYRLYFIVVQKNADLSKVVRPRALPLLTVFGDPPDDQLIWTTFSADQIDLNYRSPHVLLEMIDVLLFYVSKGAEFLRLDAVAYLWKEIGATCIHLPQTHFIIQLFRAVLDDLAPHVKLITETNVPHADNVSYFGDGHNEAQLVYNFALPPLALHTFYTGNTDEISKWAGGLTLPSDKVTFFNFLASHDGIGINPVREILSAKEIDAMVQRSLERGGLVSYKQNSDGTQSPYELNINYFDALSDPQSGENLETQIDRFIAAQFIMLSLKGLPGIYFHSLFGSRGWREGVEKTGHHRAINRQKFSLAEFERELDDKSNLRHKIFWRYKKMLQARAASPAFDPFGGQRILECGKGIFALLRFRSKNETKVLCLVNVTDQNQTVELNLESVFESKEIVDILSGEKMSAQEKILLSPYGCCWLSAK